MTILQFIAAMANALAWPATALIGILIFRKSIAERLRAIRRLQMGDKSIDFDLKLDRIEQEAAEGLPFPEVLKLPPPDSSDNDRAVADTHRFENALEIAPRFAVVNAWLPIEDELQRLGAEKGYDSRARSITFLSRRLHLDGILDRQTIQLLDDLRRLRNHAVHRADDGDISPEDARRYRELADLVIEKLRAIS